MTVSVSLSVSFSLLTHHSSLYVLYSSAHQIPAVPQPQQTSWPHTFSSLPPWKEWHHFALVVVVWSVFQAEAPLQPSLLLLYVCWRLLLMCLLWLALGGCVYLLKCWFQKQVSTATNWAETAVVFPTWNSIYSVILLQFTGASRQQQDESENRKDRFGRWDFALIPTWLTLFDVFRNYRADLISISPINITQILVVQTQERARKKLKYTVTSFSPQDVAVKAPRPQHSSGPRPGWQPASVCASGASARPQCVPHKGSPLQTRSES